MFDSVLTSHSPPREIELHTRMGNQIPNSIGLKPSEHDLYLYSRVRALYGQNWRHRKNACGYYNCFGHLFASRRTSIREDVHIWKILSDDGYRLLGESETPHVSDCVLYLKGAEDILHVGQITQVTKPQAQTISAFSNINKVQKDIWVLSKWNDCYGEDEHLLLETQLVRKQIVDNIQIWTDRQ